MPLSVRTLKPRPKKRNNPGFLAIYILLLNAGIIISSIFLHELGHLFVGLLIGCQGTGIVIGNLLNPAVPGLFSNLTCPITAGQGMAMWLGLSGFAFTVPLALACLAFRNKPEMNLGLIVLGFSIILGGLDFLTIIANDAIMYVALSIGLLFMCIGEIYFASDYLDYFFHWDRAVDAAKRVSRARNLQE